MINYPNKKKDEEFISTKPSFKTNSKGMIFEEEINVANSFYIREDIAYIYKKPTPIKILNTKAYTEGFQKKILINKAVFEKKSTTDYNGIYKGKYIDFEAKETKYKSFNIKSNLHVHQKEHLKNVRRHGGIAFLIVKFLFCNRVFIIDIADLELENSLIKFEYFLDKGIEVYQKRTLHLNYIDAVDQLLLKENNE